MNDVIQSLPVIFLHIPGEKFLLPSESHNLFGAGFVLLGSLMTAEALGDGVWLRSRLRASIFPFTLVLMGIGMVVVTVFDPHARIAHFAMGTPLAIGGLAEAKVRFEGMHRRYADLLIAAGLLFAAFEISRYHLNGPPSNGVYLAHLSVVVSAIVLAGLRLYQGRAPESLTRSLLVSLAVTALGIQLFIDGTFQ